LGTSADAVGDSVHLGFPRMRDTDTDGLAVDITNRAFIDAVLSCRVERVLGKDAGGQKSDDEYKLHFGGCLAV